MPAFAGMTNYDTVSGGERVGEGVIREYLDLHYTHLGLYPRPYSWRSSLVSPSCTLDGPTYCVAGKFFPGNGDLCSVVKSFRNLSGVHSLREHLRGYFLFDLRG